MDTDENSNDIFRMRVWLNELETLVGRFQKVMVAAERLSASPDHLIDRAEGLYKFRRRRESVFAEFGAGDLFGEPVWDMLLDLYLSKYRGKRVSVSSLCIASGVPTTTALRWINIMIDNGIAIRVNDCTDKRRVFVELSSQAENALASLLDH